MLPRNARNRAAIAAAAMMFLIPSTAEAVPVSCPSDESYTLSQGASPLEIQGACTGTGTITYEILNLPRRGTLTPTSLTSASYVPDADLTGDDQYTYRATDSDGHSAVETVKFTINPPPGGNLPPICPDPVRVFVEEGGTIELVGNCVDADTSVPITRYELVSTTPGLTTTGTDRVDYEPPANTESASFLYSASDGQGGHTIASVLITVVDQGTTEVATGTEATPETPVIAGVQSDPGSDVTIGPRAVSMAAPEGYNLLGTEFQITAPEQTVDNPLRLTFTVEGSDPVVAIRNGVPVTQACDGSGDAAPTSPCVESSGPIAGGDYRVVILTAKASVWNLGYAVRMPAAKDDCKKGGWQDVRDDAGRPFKNQGDCVSWVNVR